MGNSTERKWETWLPFCRRVGVSTAPRCCGSARRARTSWQSRTVAGAFGSTPANDVTHVAVDGYIAWPRPSSSSRKAAGRALKWDLFGMMQASSATTGGVLLSTSQTPAETAPICRTVQLRHARSAAAVEAGRAVATSSSPRQQMQRPAAAEHIEPVAGRKRSASSTAPATRRANQLHMPHMCCVTLHLRHTTANDAFHLVRMFKTILHNGRTSAVALGVDHYIKGLDFDCTWAAL